MDEKELKKLLLKKKLISEDILKTIEKEVKKKKVPLEKYLIEKGAIKEEDLYKAKADVLGFPFKDLTGEKIDQELLKIVPFEAVQNYKIIPLKLDRKSGVLEVGMVNPENVEAREALKFIVHRHNLSARIFLITPSSFAELFKEYTPFKQEVSKALTELEEEMKKEKKKAPEKEKEKIEKMAEEAPISRVVATILNHAIKEKASDVHIEPGESKLRVRIRIDGVLHTTLLLPMQIHPAVVSRIKILSNLKIDETRIPQDGRFFTVVDGKKIDFRVSTFPTYLGEKVVMRILDPAVGLRNLSDLGIEGRNLTVLKEAIKKPYGLILITGPTGSGKTTTLYSILHILNKEDVNIVSLEDPVEYYIDGINQSQVRPEIGYTFATGLRHILRQDPDKIMVGEIRDSETAQLAIHAALTGHLVLSTLHTNNALGVIPRLIDMGIDPYLIPPTLVLAIAQRLVKRLCPDSKEPMILSKQVEKIIDEQVKDLKEKVKDPVLLKNLAKPYQLYRPKISKTCPQGTKGRIGIFEMLEMTPQLEEIILKEPSEARIEQEAKRQGMTTMLQDGLIKSLKGIINFDEVQRVVEQ